ncbi:hypothetical protein V1477_017700 [Vespula maculifrons]|uniref:Uncharacterized protein n=1 Tax=Vespula maculifrons TaxID=7453 RepID=A0ABD2B6S5_VESMC
MDRWIPTIACTPSSIRRMPGEFIFSQLEFNAEKFHAKVSLFKCNSDETSMDLAENEAVFVVVRSLTYSHMSNLSKRFRLASSKVNSQTRIRLSDEWIALEEHLWPRNERKEQVGNGRDPETFRRISGT